MIELTAEPTAADIDLVTVLAALADPVRMTYVQALSRRPTATRCGEVLKDSSITISKSTLSHHLRVLREAGLTHTEVDGSYRFVSLRRDDLEARYPGLLNVVCHTNALIETVPLGV